MTTDYLYIIKWYLDASYAIHDDYKGRTVEMMSMGVGAVTSFSWKHKMNGINSTEDELIGTHDSMPQLQWTNHFMEVHGYNITENIMYQDNKSAILLESNGKMSSSKRTQHIHVRFFYINDVIEGGDMSLEYCPTL